MRGLTHLLQRLRRGLYRRFPRFMTGTFHYYRTPDGRPVLQLIYPGQQVMLADNDRIVRIRFFTLFGWALFPRTVGVWKAPSIPRHLP